MTEKQEARLIKKINRIKYKIIEIYSQSLTFLFHFDLGNSYSQDPLVYSLLF
jgi:hypothetical protein